MNTVGVGDLRNLVYQQAGDPLEQRIPAGLVNMRINAALQELGTKMGKLNPSACQAMATVPIVRDRDLYDMPTSIQAVEYMELVDGQYAVAKVTRILASDHLAADASAPGYYWHAIDSKRFRFRRPSWTFGKDYTPGLRILGTRRWKLPMDPQASIELPDGALDWVVYHAARRLAGAPGANVNQAELRLLFTEALKSLEEATIYNHTGDPVPLAEDSDDL